MAVYTRFSHNAKIKHGTDTVINLNYTRNLHVSRPVIAYMAHPVLYLWIWCWIHNSLRKDEENRIWSDVVKCHVVGSCFSCRTLISLRVLSLADVSLSLSRARMSVVLPWTCTELFSSSWRSVVLRSPLRVRGRIAILFGGVWLSEVLLLVTTWMFHKCLWPCIVVCN